MKRLIASIILLFSLLLPISVWAQTSSGDAFGGFNGTWLFLDGTPLIRNTADATKTVGWNLSNIPTATSLLLNPPLVIAGGYYTGLSYTVTSSQAAITGATAITLSQPGTYLLFSNARLDSTGAIAASHTITLNLYRTNNTAGNITGAQQAFVSQIVTAAQTENIIALPVVAYTTSNSNDAITMYVGSGDAVSNLQVISVSILPIRIY